MANHLITITNDRFDPETTSAQDGDNVTFQLGNGRTASASVCWAKGLFASGTSNNLEVTSSSSPTERVGAISGSFSITTESVPQPDPDPDPDIPITGTIRVGSSYSRT